MKKCKNNKMYKKFFDANFHGFEKNESETKKQILKQGFSDTEVWNLDTTIAKFVLPRLKRLKEIHHGYPHNLTEEKWEEILETMIKGFEIYTKRDELNWSQSDSKIIKKSLKYFSKYFLNLWD